MLLAAALATVHFSSVMDLIKQGKLALFLSLHIVILNKFE